MNQEAPGSIPGWIVGCFHWLLYDVIWENLLDAAKMAFLDVAQNRPNICIVWSFMTSQLLNIIQS